MFTIDEPHPLPPHEMDDLPEKDMWIEAADGTSPTTTGPSTMPPEPKAS